MASAMTMSHLLAPWAMVAPDEPVIGLTMHSQDVVAGGVFLAVAGEQGHGAQYLEQVLAAQVRLVICEPAEKLDSRALEARCKAAGAHLVMFPDLHRHVGEIAARYFDYPGKALRIVGVTGTDGKTSVVHYIAQLLTALGIRCGVLGTLGYGLPGNLMPTRHTTADPVSLQAQLQAAVSAGVSAVAMEVSSHALAQGRVSAIPFHTAVLTYLGRDHLDYHGSVEAYAAAKRQLFLWPDLAYRVINNDDALGRELSALTDQVTHSGYGVGAENTWQILAAQPLPDGLLIRLRHADLVHTLRLPLMGFFNAANVVAAIAAASWGQPVEAVMKATAAIQPVPGRMERFIGTDGPLVVVDYAHTPGALESALRAVRQHAAGQLWCVFGCGGERDVGKRALMGEVASRLADQVVLTSDNPRRESPSSIIRDISAGIACTNKVSVELDRSAAIAEVIQQASAEDVVLIAGKGHETVQWLGQQAIPFSDREHVEQQLLRRAS